MLLLAFWGFQRWEAKKAQALAFEVLVHCASGISRSSTLCMAHLMLSEALGWHEMMKCMKCRNLWTEIFFSRTGCLALAEVVDSSSAKKTFDQPGVETWISSQAGLFGPALCSTKPSQLATAEMARGAVVKRIKKGTGIRHFMASSSIHPGIRHVKNCESMIWTVNTSCECS